MKYAIDVAPLGDFADPAVLVRFARAAEAAGWDGFSVWDSLGVGMGTVAPDPFVALAGVAAATERIRLLLSVAVLPRRRPWLVAQSAATLDRLSGGRLILGIGAGGDKADFERFGDPWEGRIERLDAAAPEVDALLRDGTVGRSIQEPRPPIWFGAFRPGGIRRAAAWDGWIAVTIGEDGVSLTKPPLAFAADVATVCVERNRLGRAETPFEIALFGRAGLGGFAPAEYAKAGATWWLESVSPMQGSEADVVRLIEAGPARS